MSSASSFSSPSMTCAICNKDKLPNEIMANYCDCTPYVWMHPNCFLESRIKTVSQFERCIHGKPFHYIETSPPFKVLIAYHLGCLWYWLGNWFVFQMIATIFGFAMYGWNRFMQYETSMSDVVQVFVLGYIPMSVIFGMIGLFFFHRDRLAPYWHEESHPHGSLTTYSSTPCYGCRRGPVTKVEPTRQDMYRSIEMTVVGTLLGVGLLVGIGYVGWCLYANYYPHREMYWRYLQLHRYRVKPLGQSDWVMGWHASSDAPPTLPLVEEEKTTLVPLSIEISTPS